MSHVELTVPYLKPRPNKYGRECYLPAGPVFPKEEWVPALQAVTHAETIGQQKQAMTVAISNVGAYACQLWTKAQDRFVFQASYGLEGRFRAPGGDRARLSYVSVASDIMDRSLSVGYQSPDEWCRRPAFAVVNAGDYHEVFATADMPLGEVERELGLLVCSALADELDYRSPDFRIHERLGLDP